MLAVTTFPEWGWDVYAKHCISSWVKSWPGSILAYYEGSAPPALVPGVEFRPLVSEYRDEFLSIEVKHPKSYLYDYKRFCHKFFAQIETLKQYDQFYWIDADVEMFRKVPESLLKDELWKSFVTFLGRNTYTETGFIGFNARDPDFPEFIDRYMSCYLGKQIFKLPYWTDCHAFDFARNGGGNNLTPKGMGVENVIYRSVFGPYMTHHKGNRKLFMEEQCDSNKSMAS